MANLNIQEFSGGGSGSGQRLPLVRLPAIAEQNVTFTDTAAASAALNASTRIVRLQSDTDCFILVGTDPTALTTSMPLAAGAPEYFEVDPDHLISAVTA